MSPHILQRPQHTFYTCFLCANVFQTVPYELLAVPSVRLLNSAIVSASGVQDRNNMYRPDLHKLNRDLTGVPRLALHALGYTHTQHIDTCSFVHTVICMSV